MSSRRLLLATGYTHLPLDSQRRMPLGYDQGGAFGNVDSLEAAMSSDMDLLFKTRLCDAESRIPEAVAWVWSSQPAVAANPARASTTSPSLQPPGPVQSVFDVWSMPTATTEMNYKPSTAQDRATTLEAHVPELELPSEANVADLLATVEQTLPSLSSEQLEHLWQLSFQQPDDLAPIAQLPQSRGRVETDAPVATRLETFSDAPQPIAFADYNAIWQNSKLHLEPEASRRLPVRPHFDLKRIAAQLAELEHRRAIGTLRPEDAREMQATLDMAIAAASAASANVPVAQGAGSGRTTAASGTSISNSSPLYRVSPSRDSTGADATQRTSSLLEQQNLLEAALMDSADHFGRKRSASIDRMSGISMSSVSSFSGSVAGSAGVDSPSMAAEWLVRPQSSETAVPPKREFHFARSSSAADLGLGARHFFPQETQARQERDAHCQDSHALTNSESKQGGLAHSDGAARRPRRRRLFTCPIAKCGREYRNPGGLRYHLDHGHGPTAQCKKPYRCPVRGCCKRYTTDTSLRHHVVHSHMTGSNPARVDDLMQQSIELQDEERAQYLEYLRARACANDDMAGDEDDQEGQVTHSDDDDKNACDAADPAAHEQQGMAETTGVFDLFGDLDATDQEDALDHYIF
ncbi:hypothetical protein CAOG_04135 [Capsaspora owczarzaki ATCC 30864]|uniref:C2H2-type domain-containing protein n=1 Tax=Capsaspora owczarzaki (strain ATCC 30864) TaxID=595528 RepID=A0A0D2X2X7_CAPO3|nr:hypothetical protein CAOG_04135 [Capsaspora owczarzaki ATCC 30864]KJE93329.1 hypothetical protein CAOG_004135 [Capsaspora owczarzaki ATCC 30864]|eukprot:XP_004347960.2 hypothetical protein CAOG_04135 [Capsaspora owczarzaki ATCC 30864]